MKRTAFLTTSGNIKLPHTWKTYFDSACYEFGDISSDQKLSHISYALHHGLNIYDEIIDYIQSHDYLNEDSIKGTLCSYIASMRYDDGNNSANSRALTYIMLNDNLDMKSVISLFAIEVQMRFKHEESADGTIVFIQKYMYWQPLDVHKKSKAEIRELVFHPTGYKPITQEEVIAANKWPEMAYSLYGNYDLYSEVKKFVYPGELETLESFNATATEKYKYQLGVPAEPWQGNPLKAKVIVLSLNPGYVEEYNKDAALALNPRVIEGIWSEKKAVLELKAEGFYPYDERYAEGMRAIDDQYWLKCTQELRTESGKDDFDFFKDFALIQYCAYTSESYKPFAKDTMLESQMFTKDLMRYIAYNRPDVHFVIMRSVQLWRELLDEDVWFTMQPRTIINRNMSQYLSKNNLGEENFTKLLKMFG